MSLVIAIKDKEKKRIVLCGDKQSTTGFNKDHSGTKIWGIQKLPGAIMGSVGSARASQIVQNADIIDKNELCENLSTEYLVRSLIPNLVGVMKANGIKSVSDDVSPCEIFPNSFIFAYKDRAWVISNDLSVVEVDSHVAIGSGADIARGVLFATQFTKQNPFRRMYLCIEAAAESNLYVDNDIDFLTTDNSEDFDEDFAEFCDDMLPTGVDTADNKEKSKDDKVKKDEKKIKKKSPKISAKN